MQTKRLFKLTQQFLQLNPFSKPSAARGISYNISKNEMNKITQARKNSVTLNNLFEKVETHEKGFEKRAQRLQERATGPDGFLHKSFTKENILRVMKANAELKIARGLGNSYNSGTNTVTVMEPGNIGKMDMLGHEIKHHIDEKITRTNIGKDVVGKELSAFKVQPKIAKELGFTPNMPFPNDPMKSALTYKDKSADRYKSH